VEPRPIADEKGKSTVDRQFIAYFRVDGLNLDEQARCVVQSARELAGEVVKSYRDKEPVKGYHRPELRKALSYAKRVGGSLIVATLEGLSRDLVFLRQLRDSGVDFVACDLPHANASTIQVLTALAEYESRVASRRTKEGLAAYKAKGGKLGAARPESRNLTPAARAKGAQVAAQVRSAKAREAYLHLVPLVAELREAGFTLQQIADRLNEEGITTRRGRLWSAMQVSRVLGRYEP
jgi:DNA invertase Pin-like site-specific DNA recombinase